MSHRATIERGILLGFGAGVLAWGVSHPRAYLELLLLAVSGAFAVAIILVLALAMLNLIDMK